MKTSVVQILGLLLLAAATQSRPFSSADSLNAPLEYRSIGPSALDPGIMDTRAEPAAPVRKKRASKTSKWSKWLKKKAKKGKKGLKKEAKEEAKEAAKDEAKGWVEKAWEVLTSKPTKCNCLFGRYICRCSQKYLDRAAAAAGKS